MLTTEELYARQLIINQLTLFQVSAQKVCDHLAEAARQLAAIEARAKQHQANAFRPTQPRCS